MNYVEFMRKVEGKPPPGKPVLSNIDTLEELIEEFRFVVRSSYRRYSGWRRDVIIHVILQGYKEVWSAESIACNSGDGLRSVGEQLQAYFKNPASVMSFLCNLDWDESMYYQEEEDSEDF